MRQFRTLPACFFSVESNKTKNAKKSCRNFHSGQSRKVLGWGQVPPEVVAAAEEKANSRHIGDAIYAVLMRYHRTVPVTTTVHLN